MATTLEHIMRAIVYLKYDQPKVYWALNELENAVDHYLIEHPEERRNEEEEI